MNAFGVTPIDTALSVLGLNVAQLVVNFIFIQTRLSYVVFFAGFVYGLWQAVRRAYYRPLVSFVLTALAVVLILLPKRPEGTIESAAQQYGVSTHSSQAIKNQFIDYHHVPVMLAFAAQATDALVIGAIRTMDLVMPAWARFVPAPFAVHLNTLNIREALRSGVGDPSFRKAFDKFLADQYLPALTMLKHDTPSVEMDQMWPGHALVMACYPPSARKEWASLSNRLKTMMDADPRLAPSVRGELGSLTQTSPAVIEEGLLRSLARERARFLMQQADGGRWFDAAGWVVRVFPMAWGAGIALLYMVFPFLVLGAAFSLKVSGLKHYGWTFAWVKSWMLGGALASCVSLMAARLAPPSMDPSWVWERPYFCVVAAVMVLCVPVFTHVCWSLLKSNH